MSLLAALLCILLVVCNYSAGFGVTVDGEHCQTGRIQTNLQGIDSAGLDTDGRRVMRWTRQDWTIANALVQGWKLHGRTLTEWLLTGWNVASYTFGTRALFGLRALYILNSHDVLPPDILGIRRRGLIQQLHTLTSLVLSVSIVVVARSSFSSLLLLSFRSSKASM